MKRERVAGLASEAATALEVGEQLADEDVYGAETTSERAEGRGAERAGGGAVEVVGGRGGRDGRRRRRRRTRRRRRRTRCRRRRRAFSRRSRSSTAIEDDGGEFFEYGRSELPRHMRDWYEPPASEYGSFVENQPAAGATTKVSTSTKYATVRNLRSHALW